MPKVICTFSHEKPLGGGKFEKYIAGQEYEKEKYDRNRFKPVKEEKPKNKPKGKGGVEDAD